MKFRDNESNEFLFDELPNVFNPTQVVFLTHLHYLNSGRLNIPVKMPQIFTSDILAKKLISFGPLIFQRSNFYILTPFEPIEIKLFSGKSVTIMACEEDEEMYGRKLMILIKKLDKQIYFYAGICTEIRRTVLSDAFAEIISDGTVSELFLHLVPADAKGWTECERHTTHTIAVIQKLEELLDCCQHIKLIIPTFGFEPLIGRIVDCFQERVAVTGTYHKLLEYLNKNRLQRDPNKASIEITNMNIDDNSSSQIPSIKIVDITSRHRDNELQWSPFPTAFELYLLITLLKPKHIINSYKGIVSIPVYLNEFRELLKRHPGKPKLNTSTSMPKTPTTTSPAAGVATPLQMENVITPSHVNTNKSTPSPNKFNQGPYIIRKRQLNYEQSNDDSSSS